MHALSSRCFNRLIFSFCLLAAAPSGVAAFERCDNANDLSATNHTFLQTKADDSDTLTTAKTIPNDSLPTDKKEGKHLKAKIKKTGSWIKRFVRGFDDYDTEYIAPNYYNYTFTSFTGLRERMPMEIRSRCRPPRNRASKWGLTSDGAGFFWDTPSTSATLSRPQNQRSST